MTLKLQVKQVYGKVRIYPMNPAAEKLLGIMGRKTFTEEEVQTLKEIGFTLEWVPVSV